MEKKRLTPKEKAQHLYNEYNLDYSLKIVQTKIMIAIADDNEISESYWRKVEYALEVEIDRKY